MTPGHDEARYCTAAEESLQRGDLRRRLENASTRREVRARRRLVSIRIDDDPIDLRAERFLRR